MKINVIQYGFNIEKLDHNISRYKAINNTLVCLTMNQDTADSLAAQFNAPYAPRNQINMYKGNRVLIDNDLKYGEIEIKWF